MVPGRNRGGGLVDPPGPVFMLVLGAEPELGESTQGEDWLMVIAGLQLVFVWVELVLSVLSPTAGGMVVNSVVGLLAELLVL